MVTFGRSEDWVINGDLPSFIVEARVDGFQEFQGLVCLDIFQ